MSTIEVMRKALEALEQPNAGLVPHDGEWRSRQSLAIAALRAELERLESAPGLTCQTFGAGVPVPCGECNMTLVGIQELAELRAMAERRKGVEPVAFMWQHDETGRIGFIDPWQRQNGFEANNPRCKIVAPLYTAPTPPAAIPALTPDDVKLCAGNRASIARWAYALAAERAGVQIKEEGK